MTATTCAPHPGHHAAVLGEAVQWGDRRVCMQRPAPHSVVLAQPCPHCLAGFPTTGPFRSDLSSLTTGPSRPFGGCLRHPDTCESARFARAHRGTLRPQPSWLGPSAMTPQAWLGLWISIKATGGGQLNWGSGAHTEKEVLGLGSSSHSPSRPCLCLGACL